MDAVMNKVRNHKEWMLISLKISNGNASLSLPHHPEPVPNQWCTCHFRRAHMVTVHPGITRHGSRHMPQQLCLALTSNVERGHWTGR